MLASPEALSIQLVLNLQVYLRALRTYQSNNAMVTRAREQVETTLQSYFKLQPQTLNLQFLEGETFVNGNLLTVDFQSFLRAQELTRLLRGYDVGEITIEPSVNTTGLEQFAAAVYACIHKETDTLKTEFEGITLRPLHAAGAGASGAEIHRICVWLFSGLVTALETLQELHDAGTVPTMLPFKRHLRLTAEIMSERPTVFQLLCGRRPEQLEQGDSLHSAIRTIEAMGFGASLGLGRAALMTLGLSSSLDRITAHQGSLQVFEMLAKFHTLGDMAPGVMMTLWDLELIRTGSAGGQLAQILYLVDNYVTLSQRDGETSVGSEVWPRLLRAVPRSRSLISALQTWKGKVPIGSLVEHPDLGQSLVLDLTGPGGTPRLSPFTEWGVLAEPVEGRAIPKGTLSHFGKSDALRLPSDSAQLAASANTPPPFGRSDAAVETELEAGSTFGGRDDKRFVIEGLAGEGGQAMVYKVRDTRLGRHAAAKVSTARESGMRRLLLERFERELLLSSRVSHPHVLQVHDCGELADGRPYVLLEWMDRGDLVELLDAAWAVRSNLPLRHIHYYATSIASAMRAVHAAQVIHRDIKPDNILLRKDGVAKLTDFGVAKDISGESSVLTEVGQTMGTLGFMAPEQLLGLPGPQSDIFSFGITLYRLICAKVPPQVTINAIPVGRILEEAWEDVPESWTPFLKKLTAPQLEDRAASFDVVLELLRDIDPSEIDDRPLLSPEHLPPVPSAEFGAVGGVTMSAVAPLPDRPTKIPRVRSQADRSRDTSGQPIEETVSLDTVEELLTHPGDLREPLEEVIDFEISETLDLSEEDETPAKTDAPESVSEGSEGPGAG
jgi:serine/threonine protein kinase